MTTAPVAVLRPLRMPELLDQAVRLYRKHFLTFVGIIAIVQIPYQIIALLISLFTFSGTINRLQSGSTSRDPLALFDPSYFIGLALSALVGLIYVVLVNGFATAAITRAVADSYLGQPISILNSYKQVGRVGAKLVGSLILASLLGVVLVVWFVIPCVGWISGIGILMFFSTVVVPLIAPAIVIENQSAGGAIRRAWELARRRFWWVVGFVAVLLIFATIVVSGPTTLVSTIMQTIFGNPALSATPGQSFTIQTIVSTLVGMVFSLIYVPFQLVNINMMYFDLRIRTEGLDLALQTNQETEEKADMASLLKSAPPSASGNLITAREFGYFVLLSVGVGVLYIAFTAILGIIGVAVLGASGGFPG